MGVWDNWMNTTTDRKKATGYLVITILLLVLFILNVGVVEEWSGIDATVLAGFQTLFTLIAAGLLGWEAYSLYTKPTPPVTSTNRSTYDYQRQLASQQLRD